MPTYTQRVEFNLYFTVEAPDAETANSELAQLIDHIEFASDIRSEGYRPFEDEPVQCPKCEGDGCDADDITCDRCNGDGSIPFVESKTATPG